MDSNRFRHLAEEYSGGASQDSGAGGGASWTSPEGSWSNGKGKEIDPAELLFPGSCYLDNNAGQANLTNDDQSKQQFVPRSEVASCLQFTSHAMGIRSVAAFEMLHSLNSSEYVRNHAFLETALYPTQPSHEMLRNYAFLEPQNSPCMSIAMGENKEKWSSNSSCNVLPSWKGNELGTLQIPNQQIYRDESELSTELEFRCRDLQVILCKELTNSDVGNVGRVVLPKREAEAGLPPLSERDGIVLQMHDMTLPDFTWKFKYRFWPNNKSRMYVLEGTGDFVRAHFLTTGDSLIIYRNLNSGNFIIRAKKANPQQNPMNESNSMKNDNKDRCSKRFPVKQIKSVGRGSSCLR